MADNAIHPSEYDLSEFHEAVSDLLHYVRFHLPYGSPTKDFQWKIERIAQAIKPIEEVIDANCKRRDRENQREYEKKYGIFEEDE